MFATQMSLREEEEREISAFDTQVAIRRRAKMIQIIMRERQHRPNVGDTVAGANCHQRLLLVLSLSFLLAAAHLQIVAQAKHTLDIEFAEIYRIPRSTRTEPPSTTQITPTAQQNTSSPLTSSQASNSTLQLSTLAVTTAEAQNGTSTATVSTVNGQSSETSVIEANTTTTANSTTSFLLLSNQRFNETDMKVTGSTRSENRASEIVLSPNELHSKQTNLTEQQSNTSTTTTTTTAAPQEAPQDSASLVQKVPLSSSLAIKSVPVLRPSLEEEASELSRKYLNLEARRHRPAPMLSGQRALAVHQLAGNNGSSESNNSGTTATIDSHRNKQAELVDLIEKDIVLLPSATQQQQQQQQQQETGQPVLVEKFKSGSLRLPSEASQFASGLGSTGSGSSGLFNDSHYLPIDTAASPSQTGTANELQQPKANSNKSTGAHPSARRRKALFQVNQFDDSELHHCQQYLRRYSQAANNGGGLLSVAVTDSSFSNQLLPCSCEMRRTSQSTAVDAGGGDESVWLSCDHIQLIGSQLAQIPNFDLLNATPSQSSSDSRSSWSNQSQSDGANRTTDKTNNPPADDGKIIRFSQRDAGLQIIFSQKFHYLQLYALKSIDLSNNRLRHIKMDAFHGLENELEYLNLANNLLGDSRTLSPASSEGGGIDDARATGQPSGFSSSSSTTMGGAGDQHTASNRQKLIFYSDELNRLRRLKWLSLRNNQIHLLSANIFTRAQSTGNVQQNGNKSPATNFYSASADRTPTSGQVKIDVGISELEYLDLSDNLFNSIPSDSIRSLNKLTVLKLNKNRVSQLNQWSKFPSTLQHLDLSGNLISTVHHCDLIDLPDLIELNLSNNQLQHLDQAAFISASMLASLNSIDPSSSIQVKHPSEDSDSNSRSHSRAFNGIDGQRESILQLLNEGSLISSDTEPDAFSDNQVAPGRNRRHTDQANNDNMERDGVENEEFVGDEYDLETGESILTAVRNRLRGGTPAMSDELTEVSQQTKVQFNSTLRLNLSRNFFESIPGDSMVKFSHLQSLDLSNNRIRSLDSNYLCSIYNLVDNLRYIDLSGNLLHLGSSQQPQQPRNEIQLNKIFGCLQKLEKLLLSTNRLPATSERPSTTSSEQPQEGLDSIQVVGDASSTTSNQQQVDSETSVGQSNRLVIKFGDSFGSKYLNTLDLSDNQLRIMPLIEQVIQQPTITSSVPNSHNTTLYESIIMAPNQTQLNQWMSSRAYLEVLNLSYNYLDHLDGHDFEHLFNLRQLYLDYNRLIVLPTKLMRHFTSLDTLSLMGNKLTSLGPLNELLERCSRTLRVLNLANNRLMEWPQISSKLQHQHQQAQNGEQEFLSNTGKQWEAPVSLSANIVGSSGSGSEDTMTQSSSSRYKSLVEFALEELNLEGNLFTTANITSLFDQLTYMKAIKTINLSYNLLNKVRSDWFKFANRNLQTLLLSGNKINNIDLGAFALNQVNELLRLDLDYNLLKELKRKTFDSMPKIRELNLAHNLIHTINGETFHQMNSLQVLKLNNNKLTSWKCEYFSHLCNSISGNINVDLATLIVQQSGSLLRRTGDVSIAQREQQQQQQHQRQLIATPVSALIELDLSHNSLSQLRANSISVHTKLEKLNLSHNKLSFIPHDLFKASVTSNLDGRQVHLVSALRYLNLAYNRIQTVDNINFKPLRSLHALDLSHNELQTLGVDVVHAAGNGKESLAVHSEQQQRRNIIVGNNLTNFQTDQDSGSLNGTHQVMSRQLRSASNTWPSLCKLRHLNLAHNQLSMINQSLLNELSPSVALILNLSYNYLDSESLPNGFYTKISSSSASNGAQQPAGLPPNVKGQEESNQHETNFDLIFTLKLESLDLSHNRLSEFPSSLLDKHHHSMEMCNLSHNRIHNLPQNSNSMIQIKSFNLEFNPFNRETNELILFEQKSARHLNLAATRLYAIQQATAEATNPHYSNPMSPYRSSTFKQRLANQTSQLDLIRSISKPIEAPYLRHLNLSSNQLVWLAANVFDRLHSLQTLDLSNNQLTRLHLLNNQLAHVSSTLEFLSLGSNLFTNIDSNDFSQLSRIKHLDLSNLLSLQKMDCKFLSQLTTLRTLKMLNYPQLRHSLNQLVALQSSHSPISERMQRKIQNELRMSTIGGHCFQDSEALNSHHHQLIAESIMSDDLAASATSTIDPSFQASGNKWFNLEELELELFNNFAHERVVTVPGGFKLEDELRQLLGYKTRKLTLVGLNLTSLGDNSLLGVTSDELNLKISFTSITQLPLKQVLNSLAKRTKLELDLRNNNIQTIHADGLQALDELQQNNRANSPDYLSLRLASNPFRCDCNARPLWLWLNKRWESVEMPASSSVEADSSYGSGASESIQQMNHANYWLKFHTTLRASDLKCFYPLKLRGKLAQHVYYDDLVCKGTSTASGSAQSAPAISFESAKSQESGQSRQARKRNETIRLSDSYYLTSLSGSDSGVELDDLDDNLDYVSPPSESTDLAGARKQVFEAEPTVRVTRFNRYPPAIFNTTSQYFLQNFPTVPFVADKAEEDSSPVARDSDLLADDSVASNNRIGKRDQLNHSHHHHNHNHQSEAEQSQLDRDTDYASVAESGAVEPRQAQNVNTKYNKHRPNSQQKHSHFDTLSNLNQLHRAKSVHPTKHSLLTESDVTILTVASIAMTIMTFIILSICLFKYKIDQGDGSANNIGVEDFVKLSNHNKLLMSQALFALNSGNHLRSASQSKKNSRYSSSLKSSSHSSSNSSANSTKSRASGGKIFTASTMKLSTSGKGHVSKSGTRYQLAAQKMIHQQQMGAVAAAAAAAANQHRQQQSQQQQQVLVPITSAGLTLASPAQNFLMRSPTIRRVHGLASNASDWFKYTLRSYPSSGSRRRRLFIRNNVGPASGSQLSTTKLRDGGKYINYQQELNNFTPTFLVTGCPLHAFDCIQRLTSDNAITGSGEESNVAGDNHCVYCSSLLASVQQKQQHQQTIVKPCPQWSNAESSIGGTSGIIVAGDAPLDYLTNNNSNQSIKGPLKGGFQANIEHNGGYMPPKMIKALAKQLDERHAVAAAAATAAVATAEVPTISKGVGTLNYGSGNDVGAHLLETSKYMNYQRERVGQPAKPDDHSAGFARDHQVKMMRTFGPNSKLAAMLDDGSGAGTMQSGDSSVADQINQQRSQIPTIDVDGRFTYQTESLIGSSACATNENTRGGNTPTSTIATGQEDIFVLVRDTPSRDTSASSVLYATAGRVEQRDNARGDGRSNATVATNLSASGADISVDVSFMTNENECSQSSSPVAYGFMRSTPSATTLSSTTMGTLQNHYVVNKSPSGTADRWPMYASSSKRFNRQKGSMTFSGQSESNCAEGLLSFKEDLRRHHHHYQNKWEQARQNSNHANSNRSSTTTRGSRNESVSEATKADNAPQDHESSNGEQIIISRL